MLAKPVSGLPERDDLVYEPKWDGFRCIIFRDGDEVVLGSRNERPLTRYFPELVDSIRAELPLRCVVDCEIVLKRGDTLDFDALQQRIHPAASRISLLAAQTPASVVLFDLLALGDEDLRTRPFLERRDQLETTMADVRTPVYLTPATTDRTIAAEWFEKFEGAGLDGIIAKPVDLQYQENKRVMFKIKHERTADCVVAGFRWHKSGDVVGSLLLGLYDDSNTLHHVGVTASFTAARRSELLEEIESFRVESLSGHPWEAWAAFDETEGPQRRPGATSRWNAKKDLSWVPLRLGLVCEVAYDHMQGDRFRHATTFRRWRPDRDVTSCTYAQLESVPPMDVNEILPS